MTLESNLGAGFGKKIQSGGGFGKTIEPGVRIWEKNWLAAGGAKTISKEFDREADSVDFNGRLAIPSLSKSNQARYPQHPNPEMVQAARIISGPPSRDGRDRPDEIWAECPR